VSAFTHTRFPRPCFAGFIR